MMHYLLNGGESKRSELIEAQFPQKWCAENENGIRYLAVENITNNYSVHFK